MNWLRCLRILSSDCFYILVDFQICTRCFSVNFSCGKLSRKLEPIKQEMSKRLSREDITPILTSYAVELGCFHFDQAKEILVFSPKYQKQNSLVVSDCKPSRKHAWKDMSGNPPWTITLTTRELLAARAHSTSSRAHLVAAPRALMSLARAGGVRYELKC